MKATFTVLLFLPAFVGTFAVAFAPAGPPGRSLGPMRSGSSRRRGGSPADKAAAAAFTRTFRLSSGATSDDDGKSTKSVEALKTELLEKIATLRDLQDEDGKIAVDFGVKGGEIDEKSRAPRKLDFYTVSDRVGKAADSIFASVDELARVNPTAAATEGFGVAAATAGDEDAGVTPPLDGAWNLLFSTAADASFSRDSKRGDATAGNIVDARAGKITNVIRFAPVTTTTTTTGEASETIITTTKPKAVDELRVKLAATAEGPNRINLVFKYVAVKFTRFFFLPVRWTLYIPVPGPTIGKIVIGLSNLKRWLLRRKAEKRELPKAFFDVLFLDRDLRIHKTGEDNIFIQARPEWKTAWETVA